MHQKALLCAATGVLALAIACGKSSPNPASPTAAAPADAGAAADGSTLKVAAPGTSSPTGGAQVTEPTTLTASTVTGKFASVTVSYRFQVRSGSTTIVEGVVGPIASGSSVSFAPTGLTSDTTYTWRVQATTQGQNGPWSSDASFKSPVGAYIRGAELRDPLTIGRTVGTLMGAANMTPNGVNLPDQNSFVQYVLPETIQAGEFSMMITNLSTKTLGAKASVFAMGEGTANITTNNYRATIDFRGKNYPTPGSVACRIITGDFLHRIFDCSRAQVGWDPTKWYFWQFSWRTGSATLVVRRDSETGPMIYNNTIATGTHAYNPQPHVLYVGKPTPRGGEVDGTAAPITVKNVWASASPRPVFPTVVQQQ
jgi:hypothetical protein